MTVTTYNLADHVNNNVNSATHAANASTIVDKAAINSTANNSDDIVRIIPTLADL